MFSNLPNVSDFLISLIIDVGMEKLKDEVYVEDDHNQEAV